MANILICDDTEFMRALLTKIVESVGHTVVGQASNGALGVDMYLDYRPDLVLMDLTMPEMDGVVAIKYIMDADPDAKIIVVSSVGTEKMITDALRLGAVDYVLKPFNDEKILQCIEKYVGDGFEEEEGCADLQNTEE